VDSQSENYTFRREDTGELITVDFSAMMEMDVTGTIVLDNGVNARRVRDAAAAGESADKRLPVNPVHISEAMGVASQAVGKFQQDAIDNGFTGVEFVQDPSCEWFYNVRFSSASERERYEKHRHMANHTNGTGSCLDATQLEDAEKKIVEQYGLPRNRRG